MSEEIVQIYTMNEIPKLVRHLYEAHEGLFWRVPTIGGKISEGSKLYLTGTPGVLQATPLRVEKNAGILLVNIGMATGEPDEYGDVEMFLMGITIMGFGRF